MSGDMTLLFGVGATKAGTSWLYRYIDSHPDCHTRSIKELHFFDALDENRVAGQLDQLNRRRARLERRQGGGTTLDALHRAEQMADLDEYARVLKSGKDADYLSYLEQGRGDCRLVADVTPSYALLSVDRLRHMAALLPDVRFVYLLRDPVARLWSHVRMLAKRRTGEGADIAGNAAIVLDRVLAGKEDHVVARGDYRAALTKLREAVDPRKLFVAFYEELFSDRAIRELCGFLGISEQPARLDRRVHEGVHVELRPDQRARAAAFLAPQYDFVKADLGRLPAEWVANRVEV